ncbi:MAG: hypothetical protein ACTSYI_04225 [Promethearchaeota archaeon]
MIIKKKKSISLRKIVLLTLVLIPLVFSGFYLGLYLGVLVPDLTEYMKTAPDTAEFYPLEDINISRLEEIGKEFEILQEQHIPINISQQIKFNATTGQVMEYESTDNGALHTAEALTATCYRYATLSAGSEKEQALGLIHKMVTALKMLIAVPNGGLGPDYPGTAIGRFYASPAQRNDGNYTWMFDEHFRHFNGTGQYSDWRIRLYTSKDELSGYFLGLAATLMLVEDDQYSQETVKLIILQAMEGFLSSFWQEMSGDGKPNGVYLQAPCYAQWKLLLTKMATLADPENARYEQLYQYYLVKERNVKNTPFVGDMDNIDNYYSQYFENMVVLGLFLVEKDQKLLDLYFSNYQAKTYSSYRGHRNAFLNALYLGAASVSTIQPDFDIDEIRWDVLDQLWRFNEFSLVPYDTTFGGKNQTVTRIEKSNEFGDDWLTIDPNIAKWKDFVDNNAFGSLYQWLTYGLQDAIFRERYLKPATVEMSAPAKILWNRNPFTEDGNHIYNTDSVITQYHGATFTLPYYMLSYYNYLQPEGN